MQVRLIAHDIRSCHNVGSLLRTAEGLGVEHVYLTGYTPYPLREHDDRLPHIARKIDSQIHKTALNAEQLIPWSHHENVEDILRNLQTEGFELAALEQAKNATLLPDYHPADKVALLLGREVEGIDNYLLTLVDKTLEIPMTGQKESFNVVQAAAMALYQIIVGSHAA